MASPSSRRRRADPTRIRRSRHDARVPSATGRDATVLLVGTSLSVLTWNLAMLETSADAPRSWQVHDTEAAIREQVLIAAPDVLLYQELPRMVPYVETHDMIRANPRTHSGHLATLVTHDLMATAPRFVTVAGCALLTTFDDPAITIANVHLAPGPGPSAAAQRLAQLADVADASPTPALVIAGDTNTRADEIAEIRAAGFVAERPGRPTWDSRRNRFRDDAPAFTAYFTRWFASPDVVVSDVRVWDGPIERDGTHFHVSDHFALSATLTVGSNRG